jgi:two-component system chemotaxis response regulator CheY
LIVDDSRVMRLIVGKIVKETGFEVIEAANGAEGLERLRAGAAGEIALTLVDWNMPVMDGFSFVQAARADGRFTALRIIMITTENGLAEVARALAAGADEYLMKPFTKESLRDKLRLLGFFEPVTS